jgi:RimJ/RimL family protein N-acetyltransferase
MTQTYACLSTERFVQGDYAAVPVAADHIERIRQWRNAQIVSLRQAAPITEAQQLQYYSNVIWPQCGLREPDNILFAFLHQGRHIGYGGLVHIAWAHKRAEISFLLDPIYVSQPTVYADHFLHFLELMKQVAFGDLALNRLYTETYAFRVHHISVLEAAGWQVEGTMRSHVIVDGTETDSILHGYLKSDYEK